MTGRVASVRWRWALAAPVLAAAASSACAEPVDEPPPRRGPNVVFILADDLGWGDLASYGHPHILTPNLDQLAAEGTLFTQFYVAGPTCSPARAGFLTGRFPARDRIHAALSRRHLNRRRAMPDYLDPEIPVVTRLLASGGYRIGHVGKWHLGGVPDAPEPSAYGVDDYRVVAGNGPGWRREELYQPDFIRRLVDEALCFIEDNRERPFYLNLWTMLPHAVLNPSPAQMAPYAHLGPGRPARPHHKGAMQVYYAAVTALDHELGRLFRRLDELGLSRRTLVLFASDNGPEDIAYRNASHSGVGSTGPFRGRKRSLYEGGIRVPLLARWPGQVAAGRVADQVVVAGVDLLPTLCSLTGACVAPAGVDGEDAADVLTGAVRPRTRPLLWERRLGIGGHVWNRSPMLAVRDGDLKLLLNPDLSRVELYDLHADPRERDNLARRRPDDVARLRALVLDWHADLPPGGVADDAGRDDYPWPGAAAGEGVEGRGA